MNSSADIQSNLDFVARYATKAAEQHVSVLQLPENFAQMANSSSQQYSEGFATHDSASPPQIQNFLRELSSDLGMSIIAGSVPIHDPLPGENSQLKPFARCLVFGPDGQCIKYYDKIHLFDVDVDESQRYRESDSYQAGTAEAHNLVLARCADAHIGLSICYDLRFAELYRELGRLGAQILSVPSAFTYDTGKAHWEALLRARAIENQCFVFAAAQTGQHQNGRKTWGHSMIIDPWGRVLAELDRETGLIMAEIDLNQADQLRASFPISEHRRLQSKILG